MESIFRYISYVDFYDNGNKIKNVGFLRWRCHGGKHNIEIQIKNVNNLQGNFKIEEKKSGKTVGKLKLDQGIGSYIKQFPVVTVLEDIYLNTEYDQICINDVEGFYIWLKDEKYLFVPIDLPIEKRKENQKRLDPVALSEIESASENVLIEGIEEKYFMKDTVMPVHNKVKESVIPAQKYVEERQTPAQSGAEERAVPIQKYVEERQMSAQKEVEENVVFKQNIWEKSEEYQNQKQIEKKEDSENIKILEPLHEDKWQQLSKKYAVVHPFLNRNAFLSIKPEDFIIFQKGYQKLVHNSFLLHGFYNYGHLILGKLAEDESAPLYLGVPGVYYDREKQAAQMFGFVGFESTEQPVQAGSYGYYMIEVMI